MNFAIGTRRFDFAQFSIRRLSSRIVTKAS